MKVKRIVTTGLMSLATLVPCKAQKAVQLVSESGITGSVNNTVSYINGLNLQFIGNRNFADVFAGLKIHNDKTTSFASLFVDNFSWTKHISSWFRGTLICSERDANLFIQTAPVAGNVNIGKKINISIKPCHIMSSNLKDGTTTQSVGAISQMTYSIDPRTQLFFEASYSSKSTKNLFNTHFGKFKDNTSYMLTCTHKLWSK